jgi:hypothetical protein
MANWKAELDTLVDETMEFASRVAKTIRPEPRPMIPTIDPADPPPMLDTLVDEAVALATQVVKKPYHRTYWYPALGCPTRGDQPPRAAFQGTSAALDEGP